MSSLLNTNTNADPLAPNNDLILTPPPPFSLYSPTCAAHYSLLLFPLWAEQQSTESHHTEKHADEVNSLCCEGRVCGKGSNVIGPSAR